MRQQVLAAVGAIALVVGAVVVRGTIEGDDDDGGGGGGGGDAAVVCPPELRATCETLADDRELRIEDTATTTEALVAAAGTDDVEPAVWLVPAPLADAVRSERDDPEGEAVVGEPTAPLARSPVALVIWEDRAAALEAGACAGTVEWRCLGDAADRPWTDVGGEATWGRLKVGVTDPDTATGTVVLGGATAGYFDSPDYASNDFDASLAGWLGALGADAAAADQGDPVDLMITRGPGEFSAVGALEAEARTAAGRADLRVLYPAPVATADLVAVPIGDAGGAADDVAGDDDLRGALATAGWRVEGEATAPGVDADASLPADDDGLPGGGVLRALVALWNDTTG
ncbi:MAG TPA: hypothetical protein VK306_10380 [Acidimicrobiales bacterium]|nr:hypothetical protein [Acidimicrobiales bacterium]